MADAKAAAAAVPTAAAVGAGGGASASPAPVVAAAAPIAAATDASQLPVLRVGGVPEHFNLSWHLAIERGLFARAGVSVQWVEIKEGTGAMIAALKAGKVDAIVALTEGLVSEIAKDVQAIDAAAAAAPAAAAAAADAKDAKAGGDAKPAAGPAAAAAAAVSKRETDMCLLSTYVESPLTWAISTGAKSPYRDVEDLKGQTISISRFTSGSHLMTCVLAVTRGWNPQTDVKFVVKGDFASLRNSVNDGSSAAFMWETFTTKPYHDSGEVRRIGQITTPWPCFLVASRRAVVSQQLEAFKAMFTGLRAGCDVFNSDPHIEAAVAQRYGLKPEDASAWYRGVRVTATDVMSAAALERTVSTLRDAGVLPAALEVEPERMVDLRFVRLPVDIKAMKLYNKPELITALWNNLRAAGKAKGALSYRDLLPYDQNHDHGTKALDEFVAAVGLHKPQHATAPRVINVGSSVGGPARYLAAQHKLDVLAVELQMDLHAAAVELTERCTEHDMRARVTFMGGDFLSLSRHLAPGSYDAVCSWLTVLHFDRPQRLQLFKQCHSLLQSATGTGTFYADDFVALAPLTAEEQRILRNEVFCVYLPTADQYVADLKASGFDAAHITTKSLTAEWTTYAAQRYEQFSAAKAAQSALHGDDVYHRLLSFYKQIHTLFAGGRVGGIRVCATKPKAAAGAAVAGAGPAMPAGSAPLKRQATF